MDKRISRDIERSYIEPIKWCRYIVNTGYVTAAIIILAHVIWYLAARSVLTSPPDAYLRNYIVLPAIGLFAFTIFADLFIRSTRFPLVSKEYMSLALFIIFSFYLSLTHNIADVLLASFILPIFVSTVFSNVKITHWVFWISSLAVLLVGVKIYFLGKLDSNMLMQIFVACFMFLCSYLLAKVLILYGHDNLATMMKFDDRQQNMEEQLKLDPFTGLNNRKTFDDHLPKLMEECRKAQNFIALAAIDVDNFKVVNDLCGHPAGDRVLLYLSDTLKKIQTENIRAYRIGGDEFSLLLEGCNAEETYRLCEYLRTQMESCPLRTADENIVTLSCGAVCETRRDRATSAEV
ncbi:MULTISPECIES: GGDEF domain-containing protein [Synergistaceae]|uniref:GGDEF domain-containing protein n=1 Tax=Synergistaceae TaxID=649777 RepID=UPI003AE9557E|nr:diguanylate cyclase [Synergistaceae bacterium DZ-S4]